MTSWPVQYIIQSLGICNIGIAVYLLLLVEFQKKNIEKLIFNPQLIWILLLIVVYYNLLLQAFTSEVSKWSITVSFRKMEFI